VPLRHRPHLATGRVTDLSVQPVAATYGLRVWRAHRQHMTVGRSSLTVVGPAPAGPTASGAGTPTAAVYLTISATPSMPRFPQ
jgi:hypothetical protein